MKQVQCIYQRIILELILIKRMCSKFFKTTKLQDEEITQKTKLLDNNIETTDANNDK